MSSGLRPIIKFQLTEGMACHVGLAIADRKTVECPLPADPAPPEAQLSLDDRDGARAQADPTILPGLGYILIKAANSRLRNAQDTVCGIIVSHDERNRLGESKPGEEAQLIVVTLGLAPILMKRGDQYFRILDTRTDRSPGDPSYRSAHNGVRRQDRAARDSRGNRS